MELMQALKVYALTVANLLIGICRCSCMPTSTMRPSWGLSVAGACGDNLLPEPLSCQAAYLPSLTGNDDGQEVEVELMCSWSHQYPVQEIRFKHGFDSIEPQLELTKEMISITRKTFLASEQDLSVVGFFCEFSFLHPLCGPIDERSPCSITRAEVRTDPLIEEAALGGSAKISCRSRNDFENTYQQRVWTSKRINQDKFFTLTNSSRRSITRDETAVRLINVRAGDNLTTIRCNVEGNSTTKNYGLSQIRIGTATTPVPVSTNPTSILITTSMGSTTFTSSSHTTQPSTERVSSTFKPSSAKTTLLIPKPTIQEPLFGNIYFIVVIVLAPFLIVFGICMIIIMVRHRRKKKVSAEPQRAPAINENMYEYADDDTALEHEYLQSCQCGADGISQQSELSEYVNDKMLQGGRSGRTTMLLRSRSDSRLAQMAEAISLKELPKSQSAWALPGLSIDASVLNRPMPEMPGRKRSMTANAMMRPPLPRGHPPRRSSEQREYAMIDENMLSRSLNMSDTQPYACTELHPRSQTLDPKVFIPKRKHKK